MRVKKVSSINRDVTPFNGGKIPEKKITFSQLPQGLLGHLQVTNHLINGTDYMFVVHISWFYAFLDKSCRFVCKIEGFVDSVIFACFAWV